LVIWYALLPRREYGGKGKIQWMRERRKEGKGGGGKNSGEKKMAFNQGRGNEGYRRTFKLYNEYQTTTTTHQIKDLFFQDNLVKLVKPVWI